MTSAKEHVGHVANTNANGTAVMWIAILKITDWNN